MSAVNPHGSKCGVILSGWSGILLSRRIGCEPLQLVDDAKLWLTRRRGWRRERRWRNPCVSNSWHGDNLLNRLRPLFESLHAPFELLDPSQQLSDLVRRRSDRCFIVGSQAGPPDTRSSSHNGQHPKRTSSIHERHPFFSRGGTEVRFLTPASPRIGPSRGNVHRCREGP